MLKECWVRRLDAPRDDDHGHPTKAHRRGMAEVHRPPGDDASTADHGAVRKRDHLDRRCDRMAMLVSIGFVEGHIQRRTDTRRAASGGDERIDEQPQQCALHVRRDQAL